MTTAEQHSIAPPEGYLKSQSNDYTNDDEQEEMTDSTDKNVNDELFSINFSIVIFSI